MSLVAVQTTTLQLSDPRKRTSSFSHPNPCNPRPRKTPRLSSPMGTSALRRTESYITFAEILPTSSPPPRKNNTNDLSSLVPYHRTLQFYKEQRDRERRKAQVNRSVEPITIRLNPQPVSRRPTVRHHAVPLQKPTPSPTPPPPPPRISPAPPRSPVPIVCNPSRQSSPLAPTRASRPGRPVFPRSKPEPDLYRKAIKTCMQASPEGQKILRMGPRLALSIMAATKELERIVAAQAEREEILDVAMLDAAPPLSKSWVIVPGEDWEMVDCTA